MQRDDLHLAPVRGEPAQCTRVAAVVVRREDLRGLAVEQVAQQPHLRALGHDLAEQAEGRERAGHLGDEPAAGPQVRVHVLEGRIERAHVLEHLEADDEVEPADQFQPAGPGDVGDDALVVRARLGRGELGGGDVETDVVTVGGPEIGGPARQPARADVEDLHPGCHCGVDAFVEPVLELALVAQREIARDGPTGELERPEILGRRGDAHAHSFLMTSSGRAPRRRGDLV